MKPGDNCPCGSGRTLADCCGPAIDGSVPAPTAEALMRSRYTAYVLGEIDYIQATLAPEKLDKFDYDGAKHWSQNAAWKGLEVHEVQDGGQLQDEGVVEFTASFDISDMPQQHRERAVFRREEGKWFYVDGDILGTTVRRETPKIGRNEPCPCGSGKKYKKCCGK